MHDYDNVGKGGPEMGFEYVARAALVVIGVIHLLPGTVAFAPRRAAAMYGTRAGSRDLELLLRHRALLLAMIGAGTIAAAFLASIQVAAMIAVGISMTSFLALAMSIGRRELSAATTRVFRIDVFALALLAVAVLVLALTEWAG
ncbi:hypothetical protein [Nocardia brasiliensis]|uniref:hypothetical protein n=1 Tax=Nocardia brasiliensis TaxID=37326 RepID=UPI00245510F1|nr:hypothetical protein [Nocardia brasiliensis]